MKPNRRDREAARRRMTEALAAHPDSPYVAPYMTRRQATATLAALDAALDLPAGSGRLYQVIELLAREKARIEGAPRWDTLGQALCKEYRSEVASLATEVYRIAVAAARSGRVS